MLPITHTITTTNKKNLLWFILPLTIFLVPLFFLPITPDFFRLNKTYLLYAITSLSLILWVIQSLINKKVRLTIAPATLALLGLSSIYILSSIIQSPTKLYSLTNTTAVFTSFTLLFIILTSSLKLTDTKTIRFTIFSLFLSLGLISLITLFQFAGINQNSPIAWLQNKTFNPLGSPLIFLSFALPILPGLVYLSIKINHWLTKIALFTTTALTVAAIISSLSFILPFNSQTQTLILPLAAGWSITVDTFKSLRTILLGTGPDTFLYTFTQLQPAWLNLTPLWTIRFTNSSNELFTVITTAGLVAGLFWLLFSLKTINALLRSSKKSITANFALTTLVGSLIAMLIIPANISLYTLMFTSLILSTLHLKHQKLTKSINIDLSKITNIVKLGFIAISLILIGVFWSFTSRIYAAQMATFKAIQTLNKNASVSYSQQIKAYKLDPTNPAYRINFSQTSLRLANAIAKKGNLSDQEKSNITQLISQTIREAKNATQLNPRSVLGWENLARTYRDLVNLTKGADQWSIASYQQAIRLSPTNPRLRLELGGLLLSLQNYQDAIKLFNQAIELKPDWANAHYNLANAHKTTGNYAQALQEMRITAQLTDPKSDDYQTTQDQIAELEKKVGQTTNKKPQRTQPQQTQTENAQKLTTPPVLPTPSKSEKIELPANAAPEIPPLTQTPTTTPTPTPSPSPSPSIGQ